MSKRRCLLTAAFEYRGIMVDFSKYKILFFDLDGTLLTSEKYISEKTAQAVRKCKEKGIKIGVYTSRSEVNSLAFIDEINPDVIISSGGALVKANGNYIAKHSFDADETQDLIRKLRELIGEDCEITVDTVSAHYWNYKVNPSLAEANWGDSIYSNFTDFYQPSLKICVEILDKNLIQPFYDQFDEYDCIHFSESDWYKITKKNITKENAIQNVVVYYGYDLDEVISFGDDIADIGMMKMCGLGVVMGNALDEVKEIADIVIGSNDEDGIANFLYETVLM